MSSDEFKIKTISNILRMKYPTPKLFKPKEKDLKRVANLVATNLTENVQIVLPEEKIQGKKILNK